MVANTDVFYPRWHDFIATCKSSSFGVIELKSRQMSTHVIKGVVILHKGIKPTCCQKDDPGSSQTSSAFAC